MSFDKLIESQKGYRTIIVNSTTVEWFTI